jgi:hypothetical protein
MVNKLDIKLWRAALKQHYTAPMEMSFKQFRLGAMLFFFGLVLIYIATNNVAPSLAQEIITLVGLCIAGAGFVTAMLAQVRMVISRFVTFFTE